MSRNWQVVTQSEPAGTVVAHPSLVTISGKKKFGDKHVGARALLSDTRESVSPCAQCRPWAPVRPSDA